MEEGVFISIADFKKLTEYVEDIKPDFYKAEKAVEVQRIFRTAKLVKIKPEEVK